VPVKQAIIQSGTGRKAVRRNGSPHFAGTLPFKFNQGVAAAFKVLHPDRMGSARRQGRGATVFRGALRLPLVHKHDFVHIQAYAVIGRHVERVDAALYRCHEACPADGKVVLGNTEIGRPLTPTEIHLWVDAGQR